jgi:hypothetical protein
MTGYREADHRGNSREVLTEARHYAEAARWTPNLPERDHL